MINKDLKKPLIYFSFITMSLLATILNLFDANVVAGYETLWLLPLTFMIISLLTVNIIDCFANNLAVTIIWFGYFARFVLTPFFLAIGNYRVIFYQTITAQFINKAIYLMVIELVIVFVCMELYIKDQLKKTGTTGNRDIIINENNYKTVHLTLVLLILFCIAVFIYIPQINESYTSIFASQSEIVKTQYNVDDIAVRGTIRRALSSLFVFIFNIIRYLIPIYLLKYVYLKMNHKKAAYYLSVMICMLPFLVINESNIQPFFGLIINIVMLKKLYPHKVHSIIRFFTVAGALLVLVIIIGKLSSLANWQKTSGIESISLTLNAYFPGVGNVAAAYNIPSSDKLVTLFYDFLSTIPFKNSIFPILIKSKVTLTDLFNKYNNTLGNIIPCISGAEYYLGTYMASLIPGFISCLSIKMYKKANFHNDFYSYYFYMFFSMRLAFIPSMYNHIAIVNIIINQIIPIYVITMLLNKCKPNVQHVKHKLAIAKYK